MARCRLYGRDYTAWFSVQIPVAAGPWVLRGLPGLIVQAESDDGEYRFRMTAMERKATEITMPKYDFTELSHRQFRKLQQQMFRSFADFFNYHNGSTGMTLTKTKDTPVYVPRYDLIEKD